MNIQDSIIFLWKFWEPSLFAASGAMVGILEKDGYFRYLCAGRGDGGGRRYDQGCDPWEIAFGSGKPGVYVVVSVITSLAIFVLLYIKHDLLSGRLGTFL